MVHGSLKQGGQPLADNARANPVLAPTHTHHGLRKSETWDVHRLPQVTNQQASVTPPLALSAQDTAGAPRLFVQQCLVCSVLVTSGAESDAKVTVAGHRWGLFTPRQRNSARLVLWVGEEQDFWLACATSHNADRRSAEARTSPCSLATLPASRTRSSAKTSPGSLLQGSIFGTGQCE